MNIDRISPLTVLLDDIFYKSTIQDLRKSYFGLTSNKERWLLFSDYYFGDEKPNKIITLSVMPYFPYLIELQNVIKSLAPKDIKNTRSINDNFVNLINSLPIISFIFIFEKSKYFIWDTSSDAKISILEYVEVLHAYVAYWRESEPERSHRLNQISKNLKNLEDLLARGKKLRIISAMFLISLLGGYVGSLICRETALTSLTWLSDRDSTNEICNNLIRDLFQITLIDVTKKNIQFSFTTSNSDSDEWYEGITRIPDYLTGAVSGFDFVNNSANNQKSAKLLALHFSNNIKNTYLYKFKIDDERLRLQRMLITYEPVKIKCGEISTGTL